MDIAPKNAGKSRLQRFFFNFGKLLLDAVKLSFGSLVLGAIIRGDFSPSTVLYWVRNFALKVYEKPIPRGDVAIELDEMWHFLQSKKIKFGYGRRIAALPVSWLTGNAETAAPQP